MVDKHEEITLPIVLSCNYQSDITYPGQKQFDCGNPVIDKFFFFFKQKTAYEMPK